MRFAVIAFVFPVIGLLAVVAPAAAQEIRHGKVARLDLEKLSITIAVDGGKEETFRLQQRMQVLDVPRDGDLAARFNQAGVKEGAALFFRADPEGDLLNAVRVGEARGGRTGAPGGNREAPPDEARRVTPSTKELKPLTELGRGKYQGFAGGLYPDGANERPVAHEAAGQKLIAQLRPLDVDGKPSDAGKIILLSIGMSNTSQLSQGFEMALRQAEGLSPTFQFLNGAQGGMTAAAIQNPDDDGRGAQYWRVIDERLQSSGLSRAQVQAVWIKQADAGPSQGFPRYAETLRDELRTIVHVIHDRFPNCKLAYLSSRTYGGFATTRLNPEPYAYESGFAVKWLIEEQLNGSPELNYDPAKGPVRAPWLSWGPYLWAEGTTPRAADGFAYAPEDFSNDGTHHSPQGIRKGGEQLLKFFQNDSTTKPWVTGK